MATIVYEHGALVLTGIIISFITSLIYTLSSSGFIFAGRFRSKPIAVFIYLVIAALLGLFTPYIYEGSVEILNRYTLLSIIGILIIGATFILNVSIPNWRHLTPKTIALYFFGFIIFVIGMFL